MTNTRSGLFGSGAAKLAAVTAALSALAVGGTLGIVASQPEATKVVLEPINKVARDSWIEGGIDAASGDEDAVGSQYSGYSPGDDVPDTRQRRVSSTLAGATVSGGDVGVYGGSRDTQVCDKAELIGFFSDTANAGLTKSWAEVLGMQPGQVSNYIAGLTGARLRWDTRITNTGIHEGAVLTWQALLQAGTAVLVDNTGVPRVKCSAGSPLLSPEGVRNSDETDLSLSDVAENPTDAWSGLNPDDAVSIQPGRDPLQSLTIIDVQNDELLQRDVGSDGASSRDVGSGDVQFNLKWTSRADLDIHVVDSQGISYGFGNDYYQGKSSPNGGRQDVDSNIGCKDQRDDSGYAKENVFWPPGDAPAGTYTVHVRGYSVRTCSPPQPGSFTLTATVGGKVETVSGVVGQDRNSREWTFTKPE